MRLTSLPDAINLDLLRWVGVQTTYICCSVSWAWCLHARAFLASDAAGHSLVHEILNHMRAMLDRPGVRAHHGHKNFTSIFAQNHNTKSVHKWPESVYLPFLWAHALQDPDCRPQRNFHIRWCSAKDPKGPIPEILALISAAPGRQLLHLTKEYGWRRGEEFMNLFFATRSPSAHQIEAISNKLVCEATNGRLILYMAMAVFSHHICDAAPKPTDLLGSMRFYALDPEGLQSPELEWLKGAGLVIGSPIPYWDSFQVHHQASECASVSDSVAQNPRYGIKMSHIESRFAVP